MCAAFGAATVTERRRNRNAGACGVGVALKGLRCLYTATFDVYVHSLPFFSSAYTAFLQVYAQCIPSDVRTLPLFRRTYTASLLVCMYVHCHHWGVRTPQSAFCKRFQVMNAHAPYCMHACMLTYDVFRVYMAGTAE